MSTDYITRGQEQDPGDVLITFSKAWKAAAERMAVGEQLENCIIGGGDLARAKEHAPLLRTRSEMLEELAVRIKSGEFGGES